MLMVRSHAASLTAQGTIGATLIFCAPDLEEIGNLRKYIEQTDCVLFFLSKGYFFSVNCRKEIDAALSNKNPIILLHESDPNRGGAPLLQFWNDCPEELRSSIFPTDRPVIPWMRSKVQFLRVKSHLGIGIVCGCKPECPMG